jgi:hypothetical protein
MKKSTAKRAAKWWADHLRGIAPLDHGDSSETGFMVKGLAAMLQKSERQAQTTAEIDAFEWHLAQILSESDRDYITVSVDYHPDFTLSTAAQRANLKLGMTTLPWKTNMIIEGEKIKIACGYAAPFVELED